MARELWGVKRTTINQYLVTFAICNCFVLSGFDSAVFSSVQILPPWISHFGHPNAGEIGAVNTAFNVTNVVFGFFVSPIVSNRFGRRWAICVCGIFTIIGSFVMCFAPNMGTFIGGRAILGVGHGIGIPVGPQYLAECASVLKRGHLMSFWQMGNAVGGLLANYIALGCSYHDELGQWQWRIVVLLQIVPPFLLCTTLWLCPESPRWLVDKDRHDDAVEALAVIREPEEIARELRQIQEAILYEKSSDKSTVKQMWVNKSIRKRLFMAIWMNFGQQITGQGSLSSYSGIIYKDVFQSKNTIILINALNSVCGIIFVLSATFLVDRWGRRPLLFWGAVGQCCAMFGAATLVTRSPKMADGSYSVGTGAGTVVFFFAFIFFYKPSWGATTWIYLGEMFPLVARANGVAIGTQAQNVANLVLQQGFPSLLNAAGFYSFYMFSGLNIILATTIYLFYPETKDCSIEKVDARFGDVDHVELGHEVLLRMDKEVDLPEERVVSEREKGEAHHLEAREGEEA